MGATLFRLWKGDVLLISYTFYGAGQIKTLSLRHGEVKNSTGAATDKFSYFRLINSLIDYHLMQSNLEMEFENVDEMEFFEN